MRIQYDEHRLILLAFKGTDGIMQYVKEEELQSVSSRDQDSTHQLIDAFEAKLAEVQQLIRCLKERNSDILALKDRLALVSSPQKEEGRFVDDAEIARQIILQCSDNKSDITALHNQIKQVGVIVEEAKKTAPDEPETYSKIYRRQHLIKSVEAILRETEGIQRAFQKFEFDTKLKRIRFVLPEISDEEAGQLARKKTGFDQAVRSKMTGEASLRLQYVKRDILEKHQGILKLEKSIEENVRLIREVALLVEQQGEMIDNVYDNVMKAKEYVQKAETNLVKEKEAHQTSRKKMCCIIFIAIFVLCLIAVPIILKVVNSNK